MVPEEYEGLGGTEVDLAIACEALGHHLSVGPWIESAAFLAMRRLGTSLPRLPLDSLRRCSRPTSRRTPR